MTHDRLYQGLSLYFKILIINRNNRKEFFVHSPGAERVPACQNLGHTSAPNFADVESPQPNQLDPRGAKNLDRERPLLVIGVSPVR